MTHDAMTSNCWLGFHEDCTVTECGCHDAAAVDVAQDRVEHQERDEGKRR